MDQISEIYDSLCCVLIGTNQKHTTIELYKRFLNN